MPHEKGDWSEIAAKKRMRKETSLSATGLHGIHANAIQRGSVIDENGS